MGKVVRAVVGVVMTVVGVVTGNFMLVAQGVSMTFSALSEKSPSKQTTNSASQQRLSKSLVPEVARKVVLGKTAVPTDLRYWEVFGAKYHNYVEVMAAATHRMTSFGNLYIDEAVVPFSGSNATGKYAGSLKRYTKLEGASGAGMPLGSGTYWNTSASMHGCSYWVLDWAWTQEKLPNGIPSRYTQEGEGSPVYDPRRDVAFGGTHVLTDQSTWEYSPLDSNGQPIGRNNALQMLRILVGWTITSPQTGLKTRVDGRGVDPSDINLDSFIEAANNCELQRWYSDCVLSTGDSHSTNEGILEAAAGGKLVDTGGRYSYHVAIDDTANIACELTEDDLVDDAFEWVPRRPMSEQFNEVAGTYIDPGALYQSRPYALVKDDAYYAEDGFKKRKTVAFGAVQDSEQAQKLARIILNSSRRQGVFRATFQWRSLLAENYNCVRLTFAPLGFENKLFRIIEMGLVGGGVDLTLQEEDGAVYLGGTIAPYDPPSTGLGYDPLTQLQLEGLSLLPVSIEDESGQGRRDGMQVSWLTPSAHARETEIQYRVAGTSMWTAGPSGIDREQLQVVIEPLLGGTLHEFRARHNSHHGVPGLWSVETETTLTTTRNAPGEVTYDDGVPVEDLRPAQPGADVTGDNTALNTQYVGPRTAAEVNESIDTLADEAVGMAAVRDAAEAARDAALTHEENAELARDIASGHKDGAALSASIATSAKAGVIAVTRNGGFDQGKEGWIEYGSTTAQPTGGPASSWANVLRTTAGVSNTITGTRISIPTGESRFRARIRFWSANGATQLYYAGFFYYDAADQLIGATDGTGNYPLVSNYPLGAGEIVEREVIIGRGGTVPASPYGGTSVIPAGAAFMRPILYYNYGTPVVDGVTEIDYFTVEDVTAEQAAGRSATASFDSAQTAIAKADEAGDYAQAADTDRIAAEGASGLAEIARGLAVTAQSGAEGARNTAVDAKNLTVQTYKDTVLLGGNTDFQQGLEGWLLGGATPNIAPNYWGRRNVAVYPLGTQGGMYTEKFFPIDPNRKYRIRGDVFVSAGGTGDVIVYMGFQCFDAAGNVLGSVPGSYLYSASRVLPQSLAGNWITLDSESPLSFASGQPVTGEGTGTWSIFPVGTRMARLLIFKYPSPGDAQVGIDNIVLEDVTERLAADGYADASALSATTAGTYRDQAGNFSSSAASFAALGASVSVRALNRNAMFTAWPDPASVPDFWFSWDNNNTAGNRTRVAGEAGGYAVQLAGPVGQQCYFAGKSEPGTVKTGFYVIETDVRLDAGNLFGAGVYSYSHGSEGGKNYQYLHFPYMLDQSGTAPGLGVVGQTYRFSTLVELSNVEVDAGYVLYCMSRWSSFYDLNAAGSNLITWLKNAIRPATQSEIELRQARGGFSSLSGKITDVAAVAADANGVTATKVGILEARGNSANLLRKPQFFSTDAGDISPWLVAQHIGGFVTGIWADAINWGLPGENSLYTYRAGTDDGGYVEFLSEPVPCSPSKRYCCSAYTGVHSCHTNVFMYYYDAAGGNIGYSDDIVGDPSNNEQATGSAPSTMDAMKRVYGFFTPKPGAAMMRMVMRRSATKGGAATSYSFHTRMMLSEATATQTQPPPWAPGSSEARISDVRKVANDITGRVEATGGLTFTAGSRVSGVRFHAEDGTDTPYSAIDFNADVFRVWDSVASVGRAPFEVRNGGVRANAAFIDRLAVGVSLTVGSTNLRVAVQPFTLTATDGVPKAYGYDLGTNPTLVFGPCPVPLTAGETYSPKANNQTPTGFTPDFKITTPGTPTNQTQGPGGHSVGSLNGYELQYFALVAAPSGAVEVTATGMFYYDWVNNNPTGGPGDPLEEGVYESYADGYLSLAVYGYNGTTWSKIDTIYVSPSFHTRWETSGPKSRSYTEVLSLTVGSNITHIGVGVEYESHTSSTLATTKLAYQTASTGSTRSACPNGEQISVQVFPKNGA